MTDEEIAFVCHEVNRAYCQAFGDYSQVPWNDAPDWQRQSALLGVSMHADNPDAGAEASHESWLKQKVSEGWVYGETKNAETKEHPCIRRFESLPVEQQAKDYIFRSIVHSLLSLKMQQM